MVTKADVQAFMAERSEYTKANRFEDIEVKYILPADGEDHAVAAKAQAEFAHYLCAAYTFM